MSAFTYLLLDDNGVICGTNDPLVAEAAVDTGEYTMQKYAELDEIEGLEPFEDDDDLEDPED